MITRPKNKAGVEVLSMPTEKTPPETQPDNLSLLFNAIWNSIVHLHNDGTLVAPKYLGQGGIWSCPEGTGTKTLVRVDATKDLKLFYNDANGVELPFGYTAQLIATPSDLNTIRNEGLYRFVSSASNVPEKVTSGFLWVMRSTAGVYTQLILSDSSIICIRTATTTGTVVTWGDWEAIGKDVAADLETLTKTVAAMQAEASAKWVLLNNTTNRVTALEAASGMGTGIVAIANGGTGATTAAGALANLGLDFRTSAVTIYVRTDGNDSNNGLANTAAGAVASWTGVFEVLRRINICDAAVTVSFQAGTFAGTTMIGEAFQGGGNTHLIVRGIAGQTFFNSSFNLYQVRCTVYDIEFQSTVYCRENASLVIQTGCTFSGGTVYAMDGGAIQFISPTFKGTVTTDTAIQVYRDGYANFSVGMTFSGAFTTGIEVYAGGKVSTATTNNIPITFTNASFSTAFMRVGLYGGGEIGIRGTPVITGTATGVRYIIQNGGKIPGQTKVQLDSLAIGNQAGTISGSAVTHSSQFVSSGTVSNTGYLLADGTDIMDVTGQIMYVQDQKSSGMDGGTLTGGTFYERELNTVLINTIPGASLANNRITLPAGRYWIEVSAPAFAVNQHRIRLLDLTPTWVYLGSCEYSYTSGYAQTRSFARFELKIMTSNTFVLQHWAVATKASNGRGVASTTGYTEIYADVKIRRFV